MQTRNRNYILFDRDKMEHELKARELNKTDVSLEMGKSSAYLRSACLTEKLDPLAMSFLKAEYGIEYDAIKKDSDIDSEAVSDIDYDKLAEAFLTALENRLVEKGELYQGLVAALTTSQFNAMMSLWNSKSKELGNMLFNAINGAMRYNGLSDN